jgi:predicted MPP superfamily phosphohydrolase
MALQVLHLSDLHIGKTVTVERDNLYTIVRKIIEKWGGTASKPLILITGDIADDGKEGQVNDARAILDPLYKSGFRLLAIPGNHDYGRNGSHAVESRFKYFKTAFFPLENVSYPFPKEISGHMFIGLNSMKANTHFFDGLLADGELGERQINDTIGILKKKEDRKPQEKVIIYLHHHPFLYPGLPILNYVPDLVGHYLKDGHDFMHKISGRVDVLLFGHEHWHLDFSGTQISRRYRIPVILSAGKSTDETTKEYKVDDEGKADKDNVLNQGLLGRLITIQDDGATKVESIKF